MKNFIWKNSNPKTLTNILDIEDVAIGKVPILTIPFQEFLDEKIRKNIVKKIKNKKPLEYNNTSTYQSVMYWGTPFVDYSFTKDYLFAEEDIEITNILDELLTYIIVFLKENNYETEILYDDFYQKEYKAGTIRSINVALQNSVLHVDDFYKDGKCKDDFHIPLQLKNKKTMQVSFNLLLEDGNAPVDSLYVYNKRLQNKDEKFRMSNGWQFPETIIEGKEKCIYTPKVNDLYLFSTKFFHDIRGLKDNNERITFSFFGLYCESEKKFYLYN